ncbi:tyrosine-type recombinase/integrase [Micromonospora wenchangensis]|uniref:tyrosine-type recombinase/integrase n=1 Tax=Micromonospora wenchangensis TaxID=1185415 RepID=UPI00340DD79A
MSIVRQHTTADCDVHEGPPKSATSRRTIALDRHTARILGRHADRQRHHRTRRTGCPKVCHDSGYVFASPAGLPVRPGYLTQRLRLLVDRAGLTPIRLHDLRDGAATLAHTVGAALKTIQPQLGHVTIRITAGTYTTSLPATQHKVWSPTRPGRFKITGACLWRCPLPHHAGRDPAALPCSAATPRLIADVAAAWSAAPALAAGCSASFLK